MIINEIKLVFSENKLAICISVLVLVISLILGYVLEPYAHGYLNPVVEDFTQKVQSGVIKLTFTDIFLNNIRIVFQMFLLGILFCFSVFILAFNGFFVGYYVASVNDITGVLLLIIPHGIFEFSSCILACASGLVLFNFVYRFLKTFGRDDNDSVIQGLINSFNASFPKLKQAVILLIIASVLMVIAGFVEAYLTIPIAHLFVSF